MTYLASEDEVIRHEVSELEIDEIVTIGGFQYPKDTSLATTSLLERISHMEELNQFPHLTSVEI